MIFMNRKNTNLSKLIFFQIKTCLILFFIVFAPKYTLFAQTNDSSQNHPKIKEYVSIIHPIGTFNQNGNHFNFSNGYTVGFPIGINFIKSEKIAFSMEFVPSIIINDSTSKTNGLLFHPGVIFRNIVGFNFITRIGFNTNGRYGFTAVINKPILKRQNSTYFLAVPTLLRFGNDLPPSVTVGFQVGILF